MKKSTKIVLLAVLLALVGAHTVAVRIYVLLALACQTKWIAACRQRNERAPLCDFQGSLKTGLPSYSKNTRKTQNLML